MGKIRTNRSPLIKRKRETLRQGNFIRYFGYGTHHRFKNNVSLNNIYIYIYMYQVETNLVSLLIHNPISSSGGGEER